MLQSTVFQSNGPNGSPTFAALPLSSSGFVSDYRPDNRFSHLRSTDTDRTKMMPGAHPAEGRNAYRMYMLGPFTLTDQNGRPVTPKSQKAQAILAMLALSARGSRSRVWLRDKLWSDRSEDQASASLRQALLEINKALAPARDLLIADKNTVWLNMDNVLLDTTQALTTDHARDLTATEQLLEGIDIRDPEFENWLTIERQSWERRLEEGRIHHELEPRQQPARNRNGQLALLPVTGPSTPSSPLSRTPSSDSGTPPPPSDGHRWLMTLQPPIIAGAVDHGHIIAMRFQSLIAKALADGLDIGVADSTFTANSADRNDSQIGLPVCLQLRLTFDADQVLLELTIKHLVENTLLWTGNHIMPRQVLERGEFGTAIGLIGQAVDRIAHLIERDSSNDRMLRDALLLSAVNAIFRLSGGDLDDAERLLTAQVCDRPRASAYAWLSFIRTFRVGQRLSVLDAQVIEESQAYARKALELDPHNSVSLALIGHVHSFLFCEYDYAADLFEKSIRLNPALPLGWDLYAMLHCYAGQPAKAVSMARWVQELGVYSPHKYYFDTTKCISAALAGDHLTAIATGEEALRARPQFNSLLRYLASSHSHAGNMDSARHYLQRLESVEKGFSLRAFRESGYPLLHTGGGQLLIDGLIKAGARLR